MGAQSLPAGLLETIKGTEPVTDGARRETADFIRAARTEGRVFRRHPLGFLRMQLWLGEDRTQVLLHCWEQGAPRRTDPLKLHAHKYDIYSWIIAGELTDLQYACIPEPESAATWRIYEAHASDLSSVLVPTELTGNVSPISAKTHHQGDRYCIPVDVFHETVHDHPGRTMTVVLMDRPIRAKSTVAGPISALDEKETAKAPVSESRCDDLVEFAASVLSGDPSRG